MSDVLVVDGALTRELRRSVLRPHLTLADALPGDDLPDAVHLAAVEDGRPLCTCFIFADACPWRPGEDAWHLRQMATAPDAQGRGHGRAVVAAAMAYARERGATVLWCNARATAAGFYERCGMRPHGEVFTDEAHPIPHLRMWVPLEPGGAVTSSG
jgi:GNAT superfamily N-acetyltransferase